MLARRHLPLTNCSKSRRRSRITEGAATPRLGALHSQHVADAAGMVGRTRRPDMAQRCQLGRDGSQAAALASLGRSAPQAASLDHDSLGNRLAPFAAARGRALRALPVRTAYLDGELCAVRPDGVPALALSLIEREERLLAA